jgi:hypothetical protein
MNLSFATMAVAAVSVFALCGSAAARVYKVSDLDALQELCSETAEPGDVIEIQPGTYYLDRSHIPVTRSGEPGNPIIIRGRVEDGKRPVIDASRVNVKRGIFRTEESTHDVVFEDLELRNAWGARFPDRERYGTNAGAIYFQGKNLTARRVHSHYNEDGWFAIHAADNILIENCEIGHNGTQYKGRHNPTHNFYFCAERQVVRNSYIHHSTEAQNFKSRGHHTILAYNWIEEDAGYSTEVASGNEGNTLWIGNVIIKRTEQGRRQRRILGVGDGTGVARGRLTMINNTIISTQPNDLYLFTEKSSTCDVVLISNVFAGPSTRFLEHNGKGRITGTNNWFQQGMNVPESVTNGIFGDDPGFVDLAGHDFRPRRGSALIDAGHPFPDYLNSEQGLEQILPKYEPSRDPDARIKRIIQGTVDIGAFEYRSGGAEGIAAR